MIEKTNELYSSSNESRSHLEETLNKLKEVVAHKDQKIVKSSNEIRKVFFTIDWPSSFSCSCFPGCERNPPFHIYLPFVHTHTHTHTHAHTHYFIYKQGNEIIQKLQAELKAARVALKAKKKMLERQETIVDEKERLCDSRARDLLTVR